MANEKVAAIKNKKKEREARRDRDLLAANSRIRAADEQAKREAEGVNRRLAKECASTQKRRAQIDRDEQKASAIVAQGIGARVVELKSRLAALAQDEARESATALRTLQNTHLQHWLARATVSQAEIWASGLI